MSRKIWTVLFLSSLSSPNVFAFQGKYGMDFDPYVGVDAQIRHMDFKKGYGDNLFNHNFGQGNFYIGAKFCNHLGVEFGYEASITRTRNVILTTNQLAAGVPITANLSPTIFKTRAKVRGPHMDLVGYYTLSEKGCLELIGSIGLSALKATYQRQTLQLGDLPLSTYTTRIFSRYKTVLRLMAGVQSMLTEDIGIRITVGFINTSRITAQPKDSASPAFSSINPKDSIFTGLGLLWAF